MPTYSAAFAPVLSAFLRQLPPSELAALSRVLTAPVHTEQAYLADTVFKCLSAAFAADTAQAHCVTYTTGAAAVNGNNSHSGGLAGGGVCAAASAILQLQQQQLARCPQHCPQRPRRPRALNTHSALSTVPESRPLQAHNTASNSDVTADLTGNGAQAGALTGAVARHDSILADAGSGDWLLSTYPLNIRPQNNTTNNNTYGNNKRSNANADFSLGLYSDSGCSNPSSNDDASAASASAVMSASAAQAIAADSPSGVDASAAACPDCAALSARATAVSAAVAAFTAQVPAVALPCVCLCTLGAFLASPAAAGALTLTPTVTPTVTPAVPFTPNAAGAGVTAPLSCTSSAAATPQSYSYNNNGLGLGSLKTPRSRNRGRDGGGEDGDVFAGPVVPIATPAAAASAAAAAAARAATARKQAFLWALALLARGAIAPIHTPKPNSAAASSGASSNAVGGNSHGSSSGNGGAGAVTAGRVRSGSGESLRPGPLMLPSPRPVTNAHAALGAGVGANDAVAGAVRSGDALDEEWWLAAAMNGGIDAAGLPSPANAVPLIAGQDNVNNILANSSLAHFGGNFNNRGVAGSAGHGYGHAFQPGLASPSTRGAYGHGNYSGSGSGVYSGVSGGSSASGGSLRAAVATTDVVFAPVCCVAAAAQAAALVFSHSTSAVATGNALVHANSNSHGHANALPGADAIVAEGESMTGQIACAAAAAATKALLAPVSASAALPCVFVPVLPSPATLSVTAAFPQSSRSQLQTQLQSRSQSPAVAAAAATQRFAPEGPAVTAAAAVTAVAGAVARLTAAAEAGAELWQRRHFNDSINANAATANSKAKTPSARPSPLLSARGCGGFAADAVSTPRALPTPSALATPSALPLSCSLGSLASLSINCSGNGHGAVGGLPPLSSTASGAQSSKRGRGLRFWARSSAASTPAGATGYGAVEMTCCGGGGCCSGGGGSGAIASSLDKLECPWLWLGHCGCEASSNSNVHSNNVNSDRNDSSELQLQSQSHSQPQPHWAGCCGGWCDWGRPLTLEEALGTYANDAKSSASVGRTTAVKTSAVSCLIAESSSEAKSASDGNTAGSIVPATTVNALQASKPSAVMFTVASVARDVVAAAQRRRRAWQRACVREHLRRTALTPPAALAAAQSLPGQLPPSLSLLLAVPISHTKLCTCAGNNAVASATADTDSEDTDNCSELAAVPQAQQHTALTAPALATLLRLLPLPTQRSLALAAVRFSRQLARERAAAAANAAANAALARTTAAAAAPAAVHGGAAAAAAGAGEEEDGCDEYGGEHEAQKGWGWAARAEEEKRALSATGRLCAACGGALVSLPVMRTPMPPLQSMQLTQGTPTAAVTAATGAQIAAAAGMSNAVADAAAAAATAAMAESARLMQSPLVLQLSASQQRPPMSRTATLVTPLNAATAAAHGHAHVHGQWAAAHGLHGAVPGLHGGALQTGNNPTGAPRLTAAAVAFSDTDTATAAASAFPHTAFGETPATATQPFGAPRPLAALAAAPVLPSPALRSVTNSTRGGGAGGHRDDFGGGSGAGSLAASLAASTPAPALRREARGGSGDSSGLRSVDGGADGGGSGLYRYAPAFYDAATVAAFTAAKASGTMSSSVATDSDAATDAAAAAAFPIVFINNSTALAHNHDKNREMQMHELRLAITHGTPHVTVPHSNSSSSSGGGGGNHDAGGLLPATPLTHSIPVAAVTLSPEQGLELQPRQQRQYPRQTPPQTMPLRLGFGLCPGGSSAGIGTGTGSGAGAGSNDCVFGSSGEGEGSLCLSRSALTNDSGTDSECENQPRASGDDSEAARNRLGATGVAKHQYHHHASVAPLRQHRQRLQPQQ